MICCVFSRMFSDYCGLNSQYSELRKTRVFLCDYEMQVFIVNANMKCQTTAAIIVSKTAITSIALTNTRIAGMTI